MNIRERLRRLECIHKPGKPKESLADYTDAELARIAGLAANPSDQDLARVIQLADLSDEQLGEVVRRGRFVG